MVGFWELKGKWLDPGERIGRGLTHLLAHKIARLKYQQSKKIFSVHFNGQLCAFIQTYITYPEEVYFKYCLRATG